MSVNVSDPEVDVITQSIVEIRKLSKEINDLKKAQIEPIAVIGMGCEFPTDVTTPQEYWDLLCSEYDAISKPPKDRWSITNSSDINYQKDVFKGGYLSRDITEFDPLFFDIPPKEAKYLDPQHRLFLEVTWNALKSANIAPDRLNGSKTGLFCGITGLEYLTLMLNDLPPEELSAYITTGNCLNFVAGRLSYILGLKGPSLAIDTACSSSLVSVHYACRSLRNQESDLAIAGGVNLMLTPQLTLLLQDGNMLASDGKCKTFDDSADGYARGEGCGVVLLKRQSDALRDGDHIYAVVKNTVVNHDGKKSGLTVPRSESQKELMSEAIRLTDIQPNEVTYVEAHGTGTSLGDPIELEALDAVYARGRSKENPLYIGSVKSKIGHLESAAGIAGLIKVVLSIYKSTLPRHLNCKNPNHHFDWKNSQLKIVKENTKWPKGRRIATVSSFGASGTNAHAILESIDHGEAPTNDDEFLSSKYSFERSYCWYKDANNCDFSRVISNYHAYPRKIALKFQQATYKFPLHIHSFPHIKQHQIFGCVVLTGSVYLDIALTLALDAFSVDSIIDYCFKNVTLLKPITFPDDEILIKATIEVVDQSSDGESVRIKMYPGEFVSDSFDAMYSSIDIQKIGEKQNSNEQIVIDNLISEFDQPYTGKQFYERFWGHSFIIGEKFHIFEKVWRLGGKKALGYCRPLDFIDKTNGHNLNPENIIAYLNGLLFKGTLPENATKVLDRENKTFIGTGYDSCLFFESLQKEELYCYTEITYQNEDNTQFKGFATIYDVHGNMLCKMDNIGFSDIDKESVPSLLESNMQRAALGKAVVQSKGHPVLGGGFSKTSAWVYETELDYFTYPLIEDHQTFGLALFPAIGYVDLALKTIRKLNPDYKFTQIDKLQVAQPLMLCKEDTYHVRSRVEKLPNQDYKYEIQCLSNKDNISINEWHTNSSAEITDRIIKIENDICFDKNVLKTFVDRYTQSEFFNKYWSTEFILGPSYHYLETIWSRPNEAIGLIKNFSDHIKRIGITDVPGYFLQIYMSLPIAVALIPDERIEWARNNDATTIAVQIQKFVVYDNNSEQNYAELWSCCKLRDKEEDDDVWISDFEFFNENGELVAKVEGVEFRIMERKALQLIKESLEETASLVQDASFDLREFIFSSLNRIVGIDMGKLKPGTHLGSFMDSIMSLELRNEIEKTLSVLLPFQDISESESVDALINLVQARLDE